jgi:hypothetical protein
LHASFILAIIEQLKQQVGVMESTNRDLKLDIEAGRTLTRDIANSMARTQSIMDPRAFSSKT